jgi:hypothetical protein
MRKDITRWTCDQCGKVAETTDGRLPDDWATYASRGTGRFPAGPVDLCPRDRGTGGSMSRILAEKQREHVITSAQLQSYGPDLAGMAGMGEIQGGCG